MSSEYVSSLLPSHWVCLTGQTLLLTTLIGSMFFLFGRRRVLSDQPQKNDVPHAIELEDTPGVYKCGLLKDRPELVLERFFPEVSTLWEAFLHGQRRAGANGPCLGWRPSKDAPYEFLSFEQVEAKSRTIGAHLMGKFGLTPNNQTFVAIYAQNSPEWMLAAISCIRHSLVVVPIYDTLGGDAASYLLAHTEAPLVVIDTLKRFENVFSMREKTHLKHVLLTKRPEETKWQEAQQKAYNAGLTLQLMEDLMTQGATQIEQPPDHPPQADDIYIVCYTSGTTGTPKGVVLSHKNVVADISAMAFIYERFLPELLETTEHSAISYLPLSHMFEQCSHWLAICLGYRIGYFCGNIVHLSADMQALKPTFFPVVPRLMNRFNDAIKTELSRASPLKRWLFNLAKSQKAAMIQKGIVTNDTIWDRIVFAKAQQQLGGKVRLIVTGSAPIAAEVLEELRIIFGTHIVEGYGQTECTAMATCSYPGELKGGNCGGPASCTLLKLADVPDLNYFANERKGEIMLKGPHLTIGYYRDSEKTAELFDEEGFLHTGDIGHLLPNGTLRIIDRKKHIFKLAQGEYVAPEKIENVYVQCRLVQQVFVDGDSLQRYLVAIVVPFEKSLRELFTKFNENKADEKSLEDICADKRVVKAVLLEMQALGKSQRLNSIEQVKSIHLEPELFSVDNGLLTPTLKSKRPQLREKYKDVIERLYNDGPIDEE